MRQAPVVEGVGLDAQTRCTHYHSPLDVIAIKMACCGTYYACKDCHEELADHPLQAWPRDRWDEPAIVCGVCAQQLTIDRYMACDLTCPECGAAFNPGCRHHYQFYFSQ